MERLWKYRIDHIFFWVATVGFYMLTRAHLIDSVGLDAFVLDALVRNGLLALVVYFNLLVLIPKLAQRKNWFGYFTLIIVVIALYAMAKNAHDIFLNSRIKDHTAEHYFFDNTFYNASIASFYMAFSVALQLSREWYQQREHIRKIEIEKLNTELDYLKAQINPHFLFNSINTIYFQIDKHNAVARETLSSFSEMLRYQLYECNGSEVDVEKEIIYLRNYVDLQRHRKNNNCKILFNCNNVSGFRLAPLLLIPFVENAFKHVSHFSEGNEINIQLNRDNGSFHFCIINTYEEVESANAFAGGIGLKNVRRRLELLYPSRYSLDINRKPNNFKIQLEIKLS